MSIFYHSIFYQDHGLSGYQWKNLYSSTSMNQSMASVNWSGFRASLDQIEALYHDKRSVHHLEHLREITEGAFFERTIHALLLQKYNDTALLKFLSTYARAEDTAIINLALVLDRNSTLKDLLIKDHGHLLNFYDGLLKNHRSAMQQLTLLHRLLNEKKPTYFEYFEERLNAIKNPDHPDEMHNAFTELCNNNLDQVASLIFRAKRTDKNAEELDTFGMTVHHAMKDYLLAVFMERHNFLEMLQKMPTSLGSPSAAPSRAHA
jgi:hypothetical protein